MRYYFLWAGLLLLAIPLSGQRQITNFNEGWLYLEKNVPYISQLPQLEGWQPVNLPHTWNQWDATDNLPGYRRDASWYKKEWHIESLEDRRFLLYFEGANIKTSVYVNGRLAGQHIGGYVGFKIDITPFLRLKENTIAVRVDNSYDPNVIPSQKSDFFIYGGITRDVWLMALPDTHIERVLISTPSVSKSKANTSVKISIRRPEGESQTEGILLVQAIEPGSNKIAARKELPLRLSKDLTVAELQLPAINDPWLWSPDAPHLYRLGAQYLENGRVVDELQEVYGYRWYDFEPHGAFYLNGERTLLRGTHRHEEHAGFGAAMPNYLHRQDIKMIKEMGANFVRLGHYPQDPEVYKACNELGLIVWDELPWCRGGIGEEEWKKNTRNLFQEQILQNYNHPSVLFWSVGNEVYWLPDFPGGGDTTKISAFVSELHEQAHRVDPYRLTAIRKYYAGASLVDVFSPSIWSGWYAGVYTNYQQALERERKQYSRLLHMEYGGSSHLGRHTENPVTGSGLLDENDWAEVANQVNIKNIAHEGDWTENYIVDLFDWHLKVSETTDWFAGNAQWAFKDFGTPLRPENAIPYVNQKGLANRDGTPKDAYYVFKSYWSDVPFTYIESHTWTERSGPEDKSRQLCVFSNCDEVELFHQGVSMGIRKRILGDFPANNLRWDIEFREGVNQLIAVGYQDRETVAQDSLLVQYTFRRHGAPAEIQLSASPLPNGNLLIEALMVDENGHRVLDYEKRIYFSADGSGTLHRNYGTPTGSQVLEMANGHAAIEFNPGAGRTVIEARNQDFKGAYLVLDFSEEE